MWLPTLNQESKAVCKALTFFRPLKSLQNRSKLLWWLDLHIYILANGCMGFNKNLWRKICNEFATKYRDVARWFLSWFKFQYSLYHHPITCLELSHEFENVRTELVGTALKHTFMLKQTSQNWLKFCHWYLSRGFLNLLGAGN